MEECASDSCITYIWCRMILNVIFVLDGLLYTRKIIVEEKLDFSFCVSTANKFFTNYDPLNGRILNATFW